MPDQREKEKRKQILSDLREQQRQVFEQSLPMSPTLFNELFGYLDELYEKEGCDDTLKLTEQFLKNTRVSNVPEVLQWLQNHDGYCDCEVLANVAEQFRSW